MDFGVLSSLFEDGPHYLPLLGLIDEGINPDGWGLSRSINKIRRVFRENMLDDVVSSIDILLQDENWRMHLVAAIAVMFLDNTTRQKAAEKLWDRIYTGSWVSPQILVVLSKVDNNFIDRGRKLLGGDFEITYTKKLDVLESHSARGPAGRGVEENKVRLALEYLLYEKINENIRDYNGGTIAKWWKGSLENLISRGLLSFEDDKIYGGPDFFISYYEQKIEAISNLYWLNWIPEQVSRHPYWLQWLLDKVSPGAIHFLHGLECSKRWRELKKHEVVTQEDYDTLLEVIENEFGLGNRGSRTGIWIEHQNRTFKRKKNRWVKARHNSVRKESLFPELWFSYRYWGNDLGVKPATKNKIGEECPLFSKSQKSPVRLWSPLTGIQLITQLTMIPLAFVLCLQWILMEISQKVHDIIRSIKLNRVTEVKYIE